MDRHIRRISSSAMLTEAADRMKALDTDVLPVVENHRIVGTITGRDITSRALSKGMDPKTTPVRSVMTPGAARCSQDEDEPLTMKSTMEGENDESSCD